ncbi:MAG: hypothetical protein JXB35_12825 [Anaerolineae bacterium]|nr:hypothetical protein [Anaerolineae bacterium]
MPDRDYIDLRVYIDVLVRRRRVIIALCVLCAVAVFIVSSLLPKTYEASAGIAVDPRRANMTLTREFVLSEEETVRIDYRYRTDALEQILKSAQVAEAVLSAMPELASLADGSAVRLVDAIDVSTEGDLLLVTASAGGPEAAASLATTWAQEAIRHINTVYAIDPETLTGVEVQQQEALLVYQAAQQALEAFLAGSQIPELESRVQLLQLSLAWATQNQELANLYGRQVIVDQQLTDARFLRQQMIGTAASPAQAWGTALAFISLQTQAYGGMPVGQGFEYESLEGNMQRFSSHMDSAGAMWQVALTGEAPSLKVSDVEQLISVLEDKRDAIDGQIARLVGEVSQASPEQGAGTSANIAALSVELATVRAQLEAQQAQELQLTQERDVAWLAYTSLASKLRELQVEGAVSVSEVRVAFNAYPPVKSSGTGRLVSTAAGVFVAAVIGVLIVFAIQYLLPQLPHQARGIWRWLLNAPGLPLYAGSVAAGDSTPATEDDAVVQDSARAAQ